MAVSDAITVLTGSSGLSTPALGAIGAGVAVIAVVIAAAIGRRSGRRGLSQRLTALGARLGLDQPPDDGSIETALAYLEQVTSAASEAVADSSSDAIRLRRSLDTLPQGVVLCDETGSVSYRNARANALMASRRGDALAAQAVTELLEDAWQEGSAERTLDLYGPPRRTLTVRARLIDDGRRPLGVIAMIEDISERRRLEDIRRDFVANVSHELKTPMGALGLLAETLVTEPDDEVAKRLAARIHTEAFRVSRIIDDLLDLSRIESEVAPPREPVLVSLVMAEAAERVRATAEQRDISVMLEEPTGQVAILGDRRQLVSAMHALLENAVTYSYDGGVVNVAAAVEKEQVDSPSDLPARDGRTNREGRGTGGEGGRIGVTGEDPFTGPPSGSFAFGGPPSSGIPSAIAPSDGAYFSGSPSVGSPAIEAPDADGAHGNGGDEPRDIASPEPTDSPSEDDDEPTTGSHFLDEGPRRVERDVVRIAVADKGVGIPSRDLDRIFERFYRVDHGRSRDTGGTGLGLSIVRHVANNHQGWVDVQSREGEGSVFTLVLPLQPDRTT